MKWFKFAVFFFFFKKKKKNNLKFLKKKKKKGFKGNLRFVNGYTTSSIAYILYLWKFNRFFFFFYLYFNF